MAECDAILEICDSDRVRPVKKNNNNNNNNNNNKDSTEIGKTIKDSDKIGIF